MKKIFSILIKMTLIVAMLSSMIVLPGYASTTADVEIIKQDGNLNTDIYSADAWWGSYASSSAIINGYKARYFSGGANSTGYAGYKFETNPIVMGEYDKLHFYINYKEDATETSRQFDVRFTDTDTSKTYTKTITVTKNTDLTKADYFELYLSEFEEKTNWTSVQTATISAIQIDPVANIKTGGITVYLANLGVERGTAPEADEDIVMINSDGTKNNHIVSANAYWGDAASEVYFNGNKARSFTGGANNTGFAGYKLKPNALVMGEYDKLHFYINYETATEESRQFDVRFKDTVTSETYIKTITVTKKDLTEATRFELYLFDFKTSENAKVTTANISEIQIDPKDAISAGIKIYLADFGVKRGLAPVSNEDIYIVNSNGTRNTDISSANAWVGEGLSDAVVNGYRMRVFNTSTDQTAYAGYKLDKDIAVDGTDTLHFYMNYDTATAETRDVDVKLYTRSDEIYTKKITVNKKTIGAADTDCFAIKLSEFKNSKTNAPLSFEDIHQIRFDPTGDFNDMRIYVANVMIDRVYYVIVKQGDSEVKDTCSAGALNVTAGESGQLIVATYNSDDTLINATLCDELTCQFQAVAGTKIKFFLLDSILNLKPLNSVKTITVAK